MNPSCCNAITQVDKNCVNYSYPVGSQGNLLPIELVSFSGETASLKNQLFWTTAWESNVEHFIIERATETTEFETIGQLSSKGDTQHGHQYNWVDHHPQEENFYRLKTRDLDGTINYSQIIQLSGQTINKPMVFPTITSDVLQVRLPKDAVATLQLNSARGQLLDYRRIGDNNELSVRDLPPGWYYLQLSSDLYSETFRFFRSE
ncbi:MAG: T9SS type A sorting domain-containing protein [Saprospiraceae bacterium]|nr:T9SS type A sorting domain-containing protein [Saprospiraceae bacterium]